MSTTISANSTAKPRSGKVRRRRISLAAVVALLLTTMLPITLRESFAQGAQEREGGSKVATSPNAFVTQDLTQGVTAQQMAESLLGGGSGVTISNVVYTGSNQAAGTFSGGTGIIEFDGGIILSSGNIADVVGPNSAGNTTSEWLTAGDPDLDALLGGGAVSEDAAVLEFDFVTNSPGVAFQYVFSSEEYNEFVGTEFNDVFGFFINGVNVARLPGTTTAVAINTVNNNINPQYYRDNELPNATIDTEMDGLTVQLSVNASVQPGATNHLKLAIADVSDARYDSNVFIKSESFVACNPNFSDVDNTNPFYDAIRFLYCGGVISGYSDGTFRPNNNATRSQLTKIITLGEGWPIDTTGGPHFSDVPTDHPFYQFVETAFQHGVIGGYNDGTFRPQEDVTRGQITKIVVTAEGWPIDLTGAPHFTDVPAGSTFYNWIETAVNRGILTGYSDGTFRPGNPATRGQLSKIVYNAIIQP